MYQAIGYCRGFSLIRVHVFAVVVEARKICSKIAEMLHHLLFFLVCDEVGQMILDQFLFEQVAISVAAFESIDDLLAKIFLNLFQFILIISISFTFGKQ